MRKQCKRKQYVNPLTGFAVIERQKPIPRDTYLDVAILSYLNLDRLSRGLVPRVGLTKPEVDPSAIQWTTAMLLGVSLAKQAMHAGNKAGGLELLRIAESAYHAFADAADRSNKSTSGYIVLNSDQLRKSRLFCNHFDSVLQRCSIGNLVDATADAERALIKGGFKLA